MKPRYKQEFDETDRKNLIGELRKLRTELRRPIFDEDVDEARRKKKVSPPYHFQRAFGSVPAAIDAAGAGKKIYTRDELIDFLRGLDAKLKRPIFTQDIQKIYRLGKGPSHRAVEREFGGMAKARLAAGIRTNE